MALITTPFPFSTLPEIAKESIISLSLEVLEKYPEECVPIALYNNNNNESYSKYYIDTLKSELNSSTSLYSLKRLLDIF